MTSDESAKLSSEVVDILLAQSALGEHLWNKSNSADTAMKKVEERKQKEAERDETRARVVWFYCE